jgi:hypothetical protein
MLLPLVLALASPPAQANGQTTHVWITRQALELLPAGELKSLLVANEDALVHGTMFPDGGYPLGHPYGEAAHWEPFQDRYREWIAATHLPPYDDEGARHVAFFMGLGSHGMADQHFDACYLRWSQNHYDTEHGWAAGASMDEATDFKWAALTGAQELPERWLPDEVLVGLFAEHGIDVDTGTLGQGQGLLEAAITLVGIGSENPELVADYEAAFPWATAHLEDPAVPGAPMYEAERVALYWQELWDRLHETPVESLVSRTWPEDGAFGHPREAALPDSAVVVFFAEGMLPDRIAPEHVSVVDETGAAHEVSHRLYYGSDSHILLVEPVADWPENTELTVILSGELSSRYGTTLGTEHRFSFSTAEPPPEPDDSGTPAAEASEPESAAPAAPAAAKGGCGKAGLGLVFGLGLLGLGRRRYPPMPSKR